MLVMVMLSMVSNMLSSASIDCKSFLLSLSPDSSATGVSVMLSMVSNMLSSASIACNSFLLSLSPDSSTSGVSVMLDMPSVMLVMLVMSGMSTMPSSACTCSKDLVEDKDSHATHADNAANANAITEAFIKIES